MMKITLNFMGDRSSSPFQVTHVLRSHLYANFHSINPVPAPGFPAGDPSLSLYRFGARKSFSTGQCRYA